MYDLEPQRARDQQERNPFVHMILRSGDDCDNNDDNINHVLVGWLRDA